MLVPFIWMMNFLKSILGGKMRRKIVIILFLLVVPLTPQIALEAGYLVSDPITNGEDAMPFTFRIFIDGQLFVEDIEPQSDYSLKYDLKDYPIGTHTITATSINSEGESAPSMSYTIDKRVYTGTQLSADGVKYSTVFEENSKTMEENK